MLAYCVQGNIVDFRILGPQVEGCNYSSCPPDVSCAVWPEHRLPQKDACRTEGSVSVIRAISGLLASASEKAEDPVVQASLSLKPRRYSGVNN